MKSSHHITYDDLIREMERELATRERVYPAWKLLGKIHPDTANHRLECMRIMLHLLKSARPKEPHQLDLFKEFSKNTHE